LPSRRSALICLSSGRVVRVGFIDRGVEWSAAGSEARAGLRARTGADPAAERSALEGRRRAFRAGSVVCPAKDERVLLSKFDGSQKWIPLNKLSREDQGLGAAADAGNPCIEWTIAAPISVRAR